MSWIWCLIFIRYVLFILWGGKRDEIGGIEEGMRIDGDGGANVCCVGIGVCYSR